jgi:hypothetical protein
MREQAPEEPNWFAFRTDVSLRGGPLPRTSPAWLVVLLTACGCATLYGALVWFVGFDAAEALHSLADLPRMLGLVPT